MRLTCDQFIRLPHGLKLLGAAAALCCVAIPGWADPLDEVYWRTFHISPIGGYDQTAGSSNNVTLLRDKLLAQTGGVQPANVKAGFSMAANFMQFTFGSYFDYIYAPASPGSEVDASMGLAIASDLPVGYHVNGTPWADTSDQSADLLCNYLEKYNGGSLLQVDRLGRIRNASRAQEPTANEVYDGFSDQLEMQLSLSRNATVVQDYLGRNCRIALRTLDWYREQHPDLISFASMSSEYGMNVAANSEYCDYSSWSKQEFRDWLSGAGLYTGQAQYLTLALFNSAFVGATGFPWASWDAVQPPTTVTWSTSTANGRWWNKWQAFRVAQVNNMEQAQIEWCNDAGWSPDYLYGHQIPFDPASTSGTDPKYASPWTTTFVNDGGNGITTYGSRTSNTTIFSAMYANDHSWGIFEYNPQSTSASANLSALDTVWNNKGHIVCPYAWYGQPAYQILDTPFQTALQQFIFNHRNDVWSGLNYWETAPAARDLIWSMSYSRHIASAPQVSGLLFTNGIASGTITAPGAQLWLELNASSTHYIASDAYYAASFRLYVTNATPGFGSIIWADQGGATNSLSFPAKPGWNVYRLNLAENSGWREKNIQSIALAPGSAATGAFQLDWFRLEANHCWHFGDANEVYGASQITNLTVSGGVLSGISGADGFFYLATDKRDSAADADRAFINADVFKKVRVRLNSSGAATGQLYWWKRGSVPFSVDFPVQAGTQTYEVDLSSNPDWSGKVTRFRLDPVNTSGVSFQVSYISISPVMLPPRIANSDLIINSSTPVFLWEKAIENDHAGVTCQIQLAADFFFTNVAFTASNLAGGRLVYNGATSLDGLYWWRARAADGGGNSSPWSVPMPMFVRAWNFNQPGDISYSNNFGAGTLSGGTWQATTTDVDPYLGFNSGSSISRGINADVYKQFRCRVRVGTAASNPVQVFFFPKAGGFVYTDVTLPADNQWHDVVVDYSGNPQWTGYIDNVRIDPAAQAGLTVTLDSAEVLPAPAAAAQPGTWQFNTNGNFEGWSLAGVNNTGVNSGLLSADVAANNASLQTSPIWLDSSQYTSIQIRLRNGTAATSAVLSWATDEDPSFSAGKSVSIPLVPNDTGLTLYTVSLAGVAAWTNSPVTALSLQPAAGAASGNFAIDFISVTTPGAGINQAPSFVKGGNVTVLEDSGAYTGAGWATSISAGPSSESWQTVTFIVTNNVNALFSVQPAVSSSGTLTYTPAANACGSATVTVMAHDDGGTANGGQDTSAAQTFTITVTCVNDPPSFTKGPDVSVGENSGAQSLANWATAISPGPPNEAGQGLSFTVTNSNNALFSAQPAINSAGTLSFTPALNAIGSATVSAKLTDSGGTANGGQNTSPQQVFTITVFAVNQPPSFTKGPDVTVNENSGSQTLANWATAISPGPPNEAGQSVTFTVANDSNALFSVQPAISPTGTLSFTPATNSFGVATVSATLSDDGGTTNGGINHSSAQVFTITVNAVNQPPSFTKGPDVTVNENSGLQTLANWATAISPGPPNEAGQSVTFTVTNDSNALFSVQPAISPTGTLSFMPATNATGLAVVTVTAQDNGGTANGGQDTSAPQTFTLTIVPANQPPVAGADAVFAHANFTTGLAVTNLLANDTDPDGDPLTIAAVTAGTNASAVTLETNVVWFTPRPDFAGLAAFTYLLSDGQGGQSTGTVSVVVVKPLITSWAELTNGAFRLEFEGIPNTAYRLEASGDFNLWTNVSTNSTGTDGKLVVDDPTAVGWTAKFYRFAWP